jgi:hypothetical protein
MPKRVIQKPTKSQKVLGRSKFYGKIATEKAAKGEKGSAKFAAARSQFDLRRGTKLKDKGK